MQAGVVAVGTPALQLVAVVHAPPAGFVQVVEPAAQAVGTAAAAPETATVAPYRATATPSHRPTRRELIAMPQEDRPGRPYVNVTICRCKCATVSRRNVPCGRVR